MYKKALEVLIERVKIKSVSMKTRGVAFALESITRFQYHNEDIFKWFEKVIFSKLDDFIPHYLVKVLSSYYTAGLGSNTLYDKVISKIIESI